MEVPRGPAQNQKDCGLEMEQANSFKTPLGTSKGEGQPADSIEVRVL